MSINPKSPECSGNRREFLWQSGAGFTGLALSAMLEADGFFGHPAQASEIAINPLANIPIPKKAKSCIFLFMFGPVSRDFASDTCKFLVLQMDFSMLV